MGQLTECIVRFAELQAKLFDRMSGRVRLQNVRQNYCSKIGGYFMGFGRIKPKN
jgi:hypothetical protein